MSNKKLQEYIADDCVAQKTVANVATKGGDPVAGTACEFHGISFVWIPAGEFLMGGPYDEIGRDSDEGPVHKVAFKSGFWMGECTVTQKQWWNVMGSYPSEWQEVEVIDSSPGEWKGDNLPVIMVSWNAAQDFLKRLNQQSGQSFRLPSEAEWEYACRAGTTGPFSFDLPITTDKANYDGGFSYVGSPEGEFRDRPLPVRSFQPNPWGLYQMHGNVSEWVQDAWHQNYEGAPKDGSAWLLGNDNMRVLRGGSWRDSPGFLRSALRYGNPVNDRSSHIGFRLIIGCG